MASIPASGGPDYSQFKESIEIPFSTSWDLDEVAPAIDILVNGKAVAKTFNAAGEVISKGAGLDSGSTIFAISKNLVPGFPIDPEKHGMKKGEVGYATSTTSWQGYWFTVTITFSDENGNTAKAQVEALIVDKENVHCSLHGHCLWKYRHRKKIHS